MELQIYYNFPRVATTTGRTTQINWVTLKSQPPPRPLRLLRVRLEVIKSTSKNKLRKTRGQRLKKVR